MASIRQGIPHLYSTKTAKGNDTPSLTVDQFVALTAGGMIHLHNITEKTDGMTFVVGCDQLGIYTQHSGSGDHRAYHGRDHIAREYMTSIKYGKEPDDHFSRSLCEIHEELKHNQAFASYMFDLRNRHGNITLRCELLNRKLGSPVWFRRQMVFSHTRYSTKGMGKLGSIILHSQLPDNTIVDPFYFTKFSNKYLTFDHDIVDFVPIDVDVTCEVRDFRGLNHNLIMSRTTPSNKTDKVAENEIFNEIKKKVSDKVVATIASSSIENKWGPGSEGLVVHPSDRNPKAPRFKIVTDEFKKSKAKSKRF